MVALPYKVSIEACYQGFKQENCDQ